jgi:hypothetical protein
MPDEPEENRAMRARTALLPFAALLLAAALAGCGQKAEQAATATSDSLLAQSPIEEPQGTLTPEQQYQPQEQAPVEPPPAPRPAAPKPKPAPTPRPAPASPGMTVPAGTGMKIAVESALTSETAQPGDAWTGTVKDPVVVGSNVPIPAGARVNGVVRAVEPAERGSRAFLVLAIRSVEIDGKTYEVSAGTDSIIAGSTRARNVGAVAGGAAAGALIGKAVGGSNKGALIGGLIGGAAATGAVAKSKGYQATVKEGTEMSFTVNETATIKR